MQLRTLLAPLAIIVSAAAGYWAGNSAQPEIVEEQLSLTRTNNTMLEKIDQTVSHLDSSTIALTATPERRYGTDQSDAGTDETSDGHSTTATKEPGSAPPTPEQQKLYNAVKQRIYSYATSGKPLTDAMSGDEDFQKLTRGQKKKIGLEVVQRFNRGEITLDQLKGR